MREENETAPLSLTEKIGYGVGDAASNLYQGFFGLFLLYYYTDVFGLSPAAAATMLLVSKIVDAISDPAMGLIADRTDTKWGKYRPYILFGAIPYGLLGVAVFLGPEFSDLGKLIYAYVTYTAVWLAYTAINVPYSALLAVISPVAEERTKATQFRFIFASLGTLAVGALATPLVGWFGGENEVAGFRWTMALFAVLSVLLFWFTFATTKERVRAPRQKSNVSEDLSGLLKNVSWIVLAIAGIFLIVGIGTRMSSVAFALKYYLIDPSGGEGSKVFLWMDRTALFISLGLIGQLVGAIATPALARRFEKRTLMINMNIAHAILLLAGFMLTPDDFLLLTALHVVGMFTFGVIITLIFVMYTDCVQYGEWQTGRNNAGLTVSASMFSLKFGGAVGSAVPGFLLAAFGFVANTAQTDEAIFGIRLMFFIVPAVFFLIGGLLMIFYKIDRATLSRIEAELLKRHGSADGAAVAGALV